MWRIKARGGMPILRSHKVIWPGDHRTGRHATCSPSGPASASPPSAHLPFASRLLVAFSCKNLVWRLPQGFLLLVQLSQRLCSTFVSGLSAAMSMGSSRHFTMLAPPPAPIMVNTSVARRCAPLDVRDSFGAMLMRYCPDARQRRISLRPLRLPQQSMLG